jgi:hypothetical protein
MVPISCRCPVQPPRRSPGHRPARRRARCPRGPTRGGVAVRHAVTSDGGRFEPSPSRPRVSGETSSPGTPPLTRARALEQHTAAASRCWRPSLAITRPGPTCCADWHSPSRPAPPMTTSAAICVRAGRGLRWLAARAAPHCSSTSVISRSAAVSDSALVPRRGSGVATGQRAPPRSRPPAAARRSGRRPGVPPAPSRPPPRSTRRRRQCR